MEIMKALPWTAIISLVITIAVVILKMVLDQHILPYITAKGLAEACAVAVDAAEAVYGRYKGEEKLKYALNLLDEQGWDVDAEIVIANLNAAWQDLNLRQIGVGAKEAE